MPKTKAAHGNCSPRTAKKLTVEEVAREIGNIIVETVTEAGSRGAPAGYLYAALMHIGMTLSTFETLMAALVRAGRLRRKGLLYFAPTEEGSAEDWKHVADAMRGTRNGT